MKKILIACEESQTLCAEMRKHGFAAYSCDIRKCSGTLPQYHIVDNVLNVIDNGWDVVIAFPPCTYLCCSGAR